MSANLTPDEWTIVTELTRAGVPAGSATLAVVMVTREHARPQRELADVVRHYQNLKSRLAAEEAIQDLLRRDWLLQFETYEQFLIKQAPDLRQRIAAALGAPDVADRLLALRSSNEPLVQILGSMNDAFVYNSYLDLLRNAQREICLPMLATTPTLSSVPILKEKAKEGVRIRILLGTPNVVRKIRGGSMGKVASDAISGWLAHAREASNIEVRIIHRASDAILSTCMLVDDTVLRFDVYDPYRQRSLQGVMVEFQSRMGMTPNIIYLFKQWFDEVWRDAQPANNTAWFWWLLRRTWQFWIFCVFAALTGIFFDKFWGAIFGSAAATFMINWLGGAWLWAKKRIQRKHEP